MCRIIYAHAYIHYIWVYNEYIYPIHIRCAHTVELYIVKARVVKVVPSGMMGGRGLSTIHLTSVLFLKKNEIWQDISICEFGGLGT